MQHNMSNSSSNTLPRKPGGAPALPWYRHRWPWLLMLGPCIVIVAGGYTGWLAFARQDALVVGDYYKQGKAINQDLRRDRAASALGMAASVTYDAASGRLSGAVSSHGQPYAAAIRLHLAHATLPAQDIKLDVQPDAAGTFNAPLPMLERSRWEVQVENAARDWRLDGSWIWPARRSVMLRADADHEGR